MSADAIVNGHALSVRRIGDEDDRVVCGNCHAERALFQQFTWPCPASTLPIEHLDTDNPLRVRPIPHPDAAGRTWSTSAVVVGAHVKATIRHGVEGQRSLLGTLTCGVDVWPPLRAALEALGEVKEAEA